MGADDEPVGLAARFAYPAQVVLQVALVGFGGDGETFAGNVAIAEQGQFGGFPVANFFVAVEMFAGALVALFKAETLADPFQLFKSGGVDAVGGVESQRIDARSAAQVGTLLAGLVPGSESGGGGDQRDAAVGCVEITGGARFGEILPCAGVRHARSVEMFEIGEHAVFAVVEGVVVGAGDQIDAEPLQVFEQLRIGGHEGSLGDARRAFVPVVDRAFEIGEAGIGVVQNLAQFQKSRFFERRQFAREHGIAGQRDGEVTLFGLISHVGFLGRYACLILIGLPSQNSPRKSYLSPITFR